MSDLVAVLLFVGVVFYAVFGGADFGAGFWDLTAGSAEPGRRPRGLIERAVGPVWEANHVWLIYCLVVLWTAFSPAFAAIMSTLYVPLWLAAFGIVLRGSGFALSSVITPFFFGTVAGGIASGRVPEQGGGDPVTSWLNPTSLLGGALAVAVCAYLAAVFLTAEARAREDPALEGWFRRRAFGAAGVAGVLALGGVFVLRAAAGRLFDRLLGPGLPFVAVSAVTGGAALLLLGRVAPRLLRVLAVVAVAAVVAGWGVAQYPYLLGTHLSLAEAAAPQPTQLSLVVVFGLAVVLCLPSLGLLYLLQQRGELEEA